MAQQIMNAQNSIVPAPRIRSVTLSCRRLVAWSLEIGLVAMSAAVPWGLGQYMLSHQTVALTPQEKTAETAAIPTVPLNQLTTPVPLNPLVWQAQQSWAKIAQLPPHRFYRTVPRLTNILWTAALLAPIAVAGGQFLQLNYTGYTWPKRWLGLQMFSMAGGPVKLHQILGRELWRWGMPVVVVGGVALATEFSLGVWTPAAIGLLAIAESVSAIAPDKRAWHDRVANTYVASVSKQPTSYLPVYQGHRGQQEVTPSSLLNGGLWSPADTTAVQLYGETANDDEWWLTEAEGNLTSMVLVPSASLAKAQPRGPLALRSSGSKRWWLITSGMVLACAAGFGIGRVTRSPDAQTGEDVFLETAQKLANQSLSEGDFGAAILMLAQTDDPRAAHYLTDLLSQSSEREALATIQQALVSQGLESLPFLLALSRVLESDLQQSLEADTRHVRLEQRHVVQDAIAKLLAIHNGNLVGMKLDRVNLGAYRDADRAFKLIQPGLLAAGTSWQGANLSQANLTGASFFDVGADGKPDTYDDIISNLSESELVAVNLERANLQGIRLDRVNLRQANLSDANLVYGNLEAAQLTNAQLIHVNAAQSRWQGSNLVGADLTQAIFNGADLSQARLNRIDAAHSQWTKAILPQSTWIGANLMGADFRQTNLAHADFQGANLDSTNFTGADLRQANLQDTDLRQAKLTGVNLTNANLSGAIFDDGRSANDSFITPNAQLSGTNHLQGVNFSRVHNLDGRQLNYICAQGGIHPTCPKERNQRN